MTPSNGKLIWISSNYCECGACVEVAMTPDEVYVRDSNDADCEPLQVTSEAWKAFVRAVADGEIASD